ncbi:TRAP transporter large permease [Microbaculum marinum]|uniref:TRAP transporter large permease protein n=1 Tax=Microbaculum marinum TaxID=1764581 RepID=A0AAW9S0B9_9HYPH
MDRLEIALVSIPVLLGMIFVRVPIGLAMLLCGIGGTVLVTGRWVPIMASLKSLTYDVISNHSLSIVPLFLLMGQFATKGGMSESLFRAAAAFLGHRRGGVAMAGIGACAGFGAICGSSLATAATMAQVALPEMRRYGYSGALSTGSLAAGGTLGILIPPSIVLVIYAILAEQNIVKMFIAAIIPGIMAAVGFMLVVAVYVRVNPASAETRERVDFRGRVRAVVDVWPVALIFLLVIGGIYVGWFTPTEAAAVGAAGTGILALRSGELDWKGLKDCLLATAVSTAMIYFIVFGAQVYNTFLAFAQLPQTSAEWVAASGFSPWMVLVLILVAYLLFGCVMDSLSMILLTVPIFFPLIMTLDFGMSPEETAIWFGILVLVTVELGLVTPPVGMNIFIINSLAPDIPLTETYRGVVPFLIAEIIRIALLAAIPAIILFLPRMMQ